MFIAHLPSGFLLAKLVPNKILMHSSWRVILFSVLVGSVFPDFDLLYFYLIDARQHSHHTYLTHIPFYWAVLYVFIAGICIGKKYIIPLIIFSVFVLGVFLHLFLDTVAGGILWKYTLNSEYVTFTYVSAKHGWWVLNFILHWTFTFEIAITLFAIMVYKYPVIREVFLLKKAKK